MPDPAAATATPPPHPRRRADGFRRTAGADGTDRGAGYDAGTPEGHSRLAGLPATAGLPVDSASRHAARPGADLAWPVPPPLAGLLPAGVLRRGANVSVQGSTSLLFALLSAASRQGAWIALVGLPDAGIVAAAEHGIEVTRLALVPQPGPDWPAVVAALLDGLDLVVVRPPGQVPATDARRLSARARQRGAVLVSTGPWDRAEATLRVVHSRWHGIGPGHGRLRSREMTVTAEGRGSLARPRQARIWLPAPDGTAIAPRDDGTTATVTAHPGASTTTAAQPGGPADHPSVDRPSQDTVGGPGTSMGRKPHRS